MQPLTPDWTADTLSRATLRWLHRTLHTTTEVLAAELAHPGAAAPEWSAEEWAVARAVAAIHGVSALLAGSVRWAGPLAWRDFLGEQQQHTAARGVRIAALLRQLDAAAQRHGITLVALKGAALCEGGWYAVGERPMSDIDLLVCAAHVPRAVRLLTALGYRETHRTWKHQVFAPAAGAAPAALGEHRCNDIQIELHTGVSERLPQQALELSQLFFRPGSRIGLGGYPSPRALLLHLLLHAAGALRFRQLRLLHLHDIARVVRRMTDEDWDDVLAEAAGVADGSLWWAFPPLTLAERYCCPIPPRVLAYAAAGCHWPLKHSYRHRTLADSSLSHLWISAFPGIEWARSPRQMLAYAAARVRPGATLVGQRRELARLQPRVSGGSWARLSQAQRALRWLAAPQARHEALQPVRAALRDAR